MSTSKKFLFLIEDGLYKGEYVSVSAENIDDASDLVASELGKDIKFHPFVDEPLNNLKSIGHLIYHSPNFYRKNMNPHYKKV